MSEINFKALQDYFEADAIEWRQHAAQHVIFDLTDAGAFQRPEVGDIFHDANGEKGGGAGTVRGSRASSRSAISSRPFSPPVTALPRPMLMTIFSRRGTARLFL